MRKDQNFEWKETQQRAFESIKALFKKENMLHSHDPKKKDGSRNPKTRKNNAGT